MAVTQQIVYGSDSSTDTVAIVGTDIEAAFTTAMAALTNGGWIRIFPGTADYEVQDNLVINQNDVKVECAPGVVIKRSSASWAPSNGNYFVIADDVEGFSWEGGKFSVTTGLTHTNYNIFRSVATSRGSNSYIRIRGVHFDFRDVTFGNGLDLIHIEGDGSSSSVADTEGVWIEDCIFRFSELASTSTRGIYLKNCQGVTIQNNWFGVHGTGGSFLPQVALGGINMVDCRVFRIIGNHWRTISGQYFMQLESQSSEGGHAVIESNTSESGGLNYIIRLQGNDFTIVRGNNFGNHDNDLIAAISLEPKTNGTTGSRAFTITGNAFHSSTYSQYPIWVQNNVDGVDLQCNTLYNVADRQYFVGVEAGATRVRYNSNTNCVFAVHHSATFPRCVLFKNRESEYLMDAYPGTFTP